MNPLSIGLVEPKLRKSKCRKTKKIKEETSWFQNGLAGKLEAFTKERR
jgi:hypothetical protein